MNDKQLSKLLDQGENIPPETLFRQILLMQCGTQELLKEVLRYLLENDVKSTDPEQDYLSIIADVDKSSEDYYNHILATLMSKSK